jgi:hypothetical protein
MEKLTNYVNFSESHWRSVFSRSIPIGIKDLDNHVCSQRSISKSTHVEGRGGGGSPSGFTLFCKFLHKISRNL